MRDNKEVVGVHTCMKVRKKDKKKKKRREGKVELAGAGVDKRAAELRAIWGRNHLYGFFAAARFAAWIF